MRDHNLVFYRGQNDAGAGEHAGTKLTAVVRDVSLYLDQAALVVDCGFNGGDMPVKLHLRIGVHIDLDGLAQSDFGDIGLGHGEAQAHHTGIFQPHYVGTRLQVLAEEDVTQTDHATEGGTYLATGNGCLQTLDICFQ